MVWLALFSILAAAGPERGALELGLLLVLAVLQVLETRIDGFQGRPGREISILLKLSVAYVLIGFTGGVNSSYYLILLLPMVSAATSLGVFGTAVVTLLSCASYLSFLLFIDWTRFQLGPNEQRELVMRLLMIAITGYLVNTLSKANREQALKHRTLAEELAEANRHLREAEAAVRRSERLAALGRLSAGLAHELRNPLGTIRVSADMLSKSVEGENEVAREVAGFISTEVVRANSLVTRFLDFARPLELRLGSVEIGEVIDLAVGNVERTLSAEGSHPTIFRNYSPEVAPLPLDAEMMERVFYNLLLNAAQATPPDGSVTVKTRGAGGMVEIAVIDRGSGIEPAHREKIFDPFFTTKPGGVGLGLAIVAKIVDEHGGRMAVESEPGKGSIFRVLLPSEGALARNAESA
ncbi:MAG: ATP-binding protein [Bryobacteraceae bacterium]